VGSQYSTHDAIRDVMYYASEVKTQWGSTKCKWCQCFPLASACLTKLWIQPLDGCSCQNFFWHVFYLFSFST